MLRISFNGFFRRIKLFGTLRGRSDGDRVDVGRRAFGRCFEELNVSAPEVVSRIHDAYVQAGARLIETNTFGANAARLSRHGLQDRVRELNQAAIRLARKSIGQRPIYLAASIGPLGIADPETELQDIDRATFQRTSRGHPGCEGGRSFPGDFC